MINELDIYFECGLKAGKAAKYQDWSLVNFQKSWLTRAINLETGENKTLARAEYDKGYKEGRGV